MEERILIEKKLKITLIIGFLLLITFIITMNLRSMIDISGMKAFKLGNKTIVIHKLKKTRIITNPDSIKKYLNINGDVSFLIIDDSTSNPINKVFASYLQAGDLTDFRDLVNLIKSDSTASVIETKIRNDELYVKQMIVDEELKFSVYILSRYSLCYPYYLLVRSIWFGGEKTPNRIKEIMNSIEVRE